MRCYLSMPDLLWNMRRPFGSTRFTVGIGIKSINLNNFFTGLARRPEALVFVFADPSCRKGPDLRASDP